MAAPRAISLGQIDGKDLTMTPDERRTHLHVVGPSNSGKTRLLEHMIRQDILAGHGVVVIDPTSALYQRLAAWCAARGLHRRRRLHFFDPNDDSHIIGFNPLARQPGEEVSKRVDSMVKACARVWSEETSATPLLKRCLRAVFTALIEHDQTLVEAVELVMLPTNDRDARIRSLLTQIENPYLQRVWDQFERLKEDRYEEVFSSTNNRLADFLSSERMTRIFGLGPGSLDLRQCMNESHCLFVNLQPLHISEDNAQLLGTLITNELLLLARARDNDLAERRPFYAYIDEAYQFLTEDIEQAIDLTRQKGLHYILAHQRLSQLTDAGTKIYGGVMSIRNKLVFGDLDAEDTEVLAREFFQSSYDENEEIQALRRPVVVAHKTRQNRQFRTTKNRGRARGRAESKMAGSSEGDNSVFSLPTDALGALSGQLVDGSSASFALTVAESRAESDVVNESDGVTEGWAESQEPVLEERPGGMRSFDEQMHIYAKVLRGLPKRTALLKRRAQAPMILAVPYVGDPVTRASRLPMFLTAAAENSAFTFSIDEADTTRHSRKDMLEQSADDRVVDIPDSPAGFFE